MPAGMDVNITFFTGNFHLHFRFGTQPTIQQGQGIRIGKDHPDLFLDACFMKMRDGLKTLRDAQNPVGQEYRIYSNIQKRAARKCRV